MPSFYRLVSSISCRTYSSSTSFLHWPTCLWTALLFASSVCSSPVSDLFHVYCSQSLSMLLVCLSPSLQTYSTPSFSLISLPIIASVLSIPLLVWAIGGWGAHGLWLYVELRMPIFLAVKQTNWHIEQRWLKTDLSLLFL